jgi:O-acetyl-ADP-ribose deacetylase
LNINILQGDITKQKSDAIVNAANGLLQHNGGVAKAIADAVGDELRDECEQYVRNYGALRTSQVMHSTSGRLRNNVKYVIHAVGPMNGDTDCEALLHQTFLNCLRYANNTLRLNSISIPAISSGTVTS